MDGFFQTCNVCCIAAKPAEDQTDLRPDYLEPACWKSSVSVGRYFMNSSLNQT